MEKKESGLCIENLSVSVDGKLVLENISLFVPQGEVHALMGPNGSGKSTLSYVIAGHPKYKVESGSIMFNGSNILNLMPSERANLGLFLAFQYPLEIPGVNLGHFLYSILKAKQPSISPIDFKKKLDHALELLSIDKSFVERELNVGFSGGEKKRAEVLQLVLTKPLLAIFDETDSGLDVDSLKVVCNAITACRDSEFSAIVVTHHIKILEQLSPDKVHVLSGGRIVESGSLLLAEHIQEKGYGK